MNRITRNVLAGVVGLLLAGLTTRGADTPGARGPVPAPEQAGEERERPGLKEAATLRDYLTYAARHNAGLEAAFNRWKAELEKMRQAGALPDPRLTYGYFIEEVETRVGPQKNKLGLAQMFPWLGKRQLREDVAAEAAEAAYEQYLAARLQLFYEVKSAYFEYRYLHRAISVTEDNLRLLEHLESVARSKHRGGAPQTAVVRAQVELGKMDDRLRTLRAARDPVVAMLNAALNRPYDAPLPWPGAEPPTGVVAVDEALFDRLAASPELRRLDALVRREERAVDLARKEFYPDWVLGVDYTSTDEALMPGTPDSGKDPLMAHVALDIPLWRGRYHAGVEEARHRRRAAARAREEMGNRLQADLRRVLYRFHDAERKIDLYGDTLVPQAEQALKLTEEAYRTGTGDFLDLIDAERLLLEFQLAHERALADREIAVARLEQLVGQPLDATRNQQESE